MMEHYGAPPEAIVRLRSKLADAEHKLRGHLEHQGIPIAVENPKGSVRSGVDKSGKPWRTVMKHPYGYIQGTKGADGEEVDAYVGPKKDATHAYVVHQHKDNGTGYDEDKVMLGFKDEQAARRAYLQHYDDPKFLGPISAVPIERLKALISEKKRLVKISEPMQASFLDELGQIHRAWGAA
jgi:hypothetical protein